MKDILDAWKETARRHGLSEEWAKAKAEVHIAQLQVPAPPAPLAPAAEPVAVSLPSSAVPIVMSPPSLTEVHNRLNWIIALLALIAMLLVFSIRSHAQYSHINSISFQNNGVAVTGGFFTYPFVMNFTGTGCTASVTGSVVSVNCSSAGGSGTTLTINGSGLAGTVNLNGTTPAAPAGSQNITWQYSAGNASAYTALFPSTIANATHKWLNSYTASTGVFTQTQPACGDLSDAGTGCSASALPPNGAASGDLSGTYPGPNVASTHITGGTNSDLAAFNATGNMVNFAGSTITAGQMPTAISAAGALTGTATPTLGASGTLGSLTMGNATSGLITIQPTTGAITSYTFGLPVAQPTAGNTYLSCTAANPSVCSWTGSTVTSVNTLTGSVVIEAATAGQLAVSGGSGAAMTGAGNFTYSTNTLSMAAAGLLDLSAATGQNSFKVPAHSGNAVTANAAINFDTTNLDYHAFVNSADSRVAVYPATETPVNGHCVTWVPAGQAWTLGDVSCSGGGISGLTTNVIPKAASATTITNSALDDGVTTANTLTYTGSAGFTVAAGAAIGSADTGTPNFTFGTNKVTLNKALYLGSTSNQIVSGTTTNLTTLTFPASSGAVTLTFPITTLYMLGAASDTTTTHVLHATATAGVGSFGAIATGDLPTIPIAGGGTNATSAAAGTVPNATSSSASSWTATPTLGVQATTAGSLTIAGTSGTSGTLTLNGGTSGSAAITSSATGVLALPSGTTATSMALTTPNIGVATATSVNKVAITAPASSATLTIADGKTLTASNTMDVSKNAGVAGALVWNDTTTSQSASALLTQYGVIIGGGASAAPSTISADTTTTHALFATATSPAFRAVAAGDLPATLTSGTAITNAALTTPAIGAATGTSLYATGIIDGKATVNVSTTTPCTLGTASANCSAVSSLAGYTVNEHATAATAITYTLPTAAAGLQYCVSNGYNGSAANTGVLTIATSASGQFIIFTDGTLTATGGNITSGGAAADAACVVGVDTTHWLLYVNRGTWTKH